MIPERKYSPGRPGLPSMKQLFAGLLAALLALTGCGGSVRAMAAEALARLEPAESITGRKRQMAAARAMNCSCMICRQST